MRLREACILSEMVNVRTHGATPDGISDDTAAINSALAAGTSIYFPPGRYNYTGRITLPAGKAYRLYGDGPGISTILFTGPQAGIFAPTVNDQTLQVDGLTLTALTASAGTAISATFNRGDFAKSRTACIFNVEIRGSNRSGSTGGCWTKGIYLYKAPNTVIDKVVVDGNEGLTLTGIEWSSPATSATTGLFLTGTELKLCNTAVVTSGWVEGFYMSGFEVVLCGSGGNPALNLQSSQAVSPSPTFTLLNGHIDFFADGARMTNLSAVKVCQVDFEHTSPVVIDGGHLVLTNCIGAIVTDCTFTSQTNKINNENGVFLTATQQARVAGNIFRNIYPLQTGSPIVAYTGSKTVRISGNIYKNCRNSFDNYIGGEAYNDADNVIVQ